MIYDHVDNLEHYFSADNSHLIKNFLDELPAEDGSYELNGKQLVAILSTYWPRLFGDSQYESHSKYSDLQIMVKGEELIFYHPICELEKHEEKLEDDIVFYKKINSGLSFTVSNKMFCIFNPHDGHLPSIGRAGEEQLRKVVFKIAVQS